MNFKYINYYESKNKNKIKKLYLNAFPKEERFPFQILKYCSKQPNVIFNEILDNDKSIGMEYIIKCDDVYYLMYFAVYEEERKKNHGSKILDEIKGIYKNIFLSIERADTNINRKRKKFYLKNGFFETKKFYIDNGVEYEILSTNSTSEITKEKLQQRYNNMTNSNIIKFYISRIFNVNNIKFLK